VNPVGVGRLFVLRVSSSVTNRSRRSPVATDDGFVTRNPASLPVFELKDSRTGAAMRHPYDYGVRSRVKMPLALKLRTKSPDDDD